MNEFIELLIKLPVVLVVLFILLRIMGNKEVNQSTPIEFAYMVLMVSILWDMSLDTNWNLWQTIVTMIFLTVLMFLVDKWTHKSKKVEKFLIGEPKTIIYCGVINDVLLEEERISKNELLSRLRVKGVFDYKKVELCYLEPSGEISVKLYGEDVNI